MSILLPKGFSAMRLFRFSQDFSHKLRGKWIQEEIPIYAKTVLFNFIRDVASSWQPAIPARSSNIVKIASC